MLQLDEVSLYASGLALLEQNLHTLDNMGLFEDKVGADAGVIFFRDGMPSLSSSYNISGLVPACWLLFQCFVLKPAKLPKGFSKR